MLSRSFKRKIPRQIAASPLRGRRRRALSTAADISTVILSLQRTTSPRVAGRRRTTRRVRDRRHTREDPRAMHREAPSGARAGSEIVAIRSPCRASAVTLADSRAFRCSIRSNIVDSALSLALLRHGRSASPRASGSGLFDAMYAHHLSCFRALRLRRHRSVVPEWPSLPCSRAHRLRNLKRFRDANRRVGIILLHLNSWRAGALLSSSNGSRVGGELRMRAFPGKFEKSARSSA